MTDFRALCVELTDCLEKADWPHRYKAVFQQWTDIARAALAEPKEAMRPKPPSLKEQALAELDDAVIRGDCITISDALPVIRRALESLPD